MAKMCPICAVKQGGLCIHEKVMLGMMALIAIGVAIILVIALV